MIYNIICIFVTIVAISSNTIEFDFFSNPVDMSKIVYCVEEAQNEEYPEGWIEEFNQNIEELQKIFVNGKYWNHMNDFKIMNEDINNIEKFEDIMSYLSVTNIPCNNFLYGEKYCNVYNGKSDEVYPYESISNQCWGFSSMLSDMIFGENASVRKYYDYNKIRVGDQARIYDDSHTVFIIDKTDEYIVVAECNEDYETCKITWGRKILKRDLSNCWYITRWD